MPKPIDELLNLMTQIFCLGSFSELISRYGMHLEYQQYSIKCVENKISFLSSLGTTITVQSRDFACARK